MSQPCLMTVRFSDSADPDVRAAPLLRPRHLPRISWLCAQTLKARIRDLLQRIAADEGSPETAELERQVRHFQLVGLEATTSLNPVLSKPVWSMRSCPFCCALVPAVIHIRDGQVPLILLSIRQA